MTMTTSVARSFQALGYSFELAGNDDELLRRAASCLRDLAVEAHRRPAHRVRYDLLRGMSPRTHRLMCDGELVVDDAASSHVLDFLLWHINMRVTRGHLPRHVVLHAAAAVLDGRAIVLPGPSGSGKTTTVSGLVQRGFGYLTDEVAAVSVEDRHVEPFPKSLGIGHGSWPVLERLRSFDAGATRAGWYVPVGALPAARLAARSPVDFVVFPRYRRDRETSLEPVARAAAVVEMAAATFGFSDAPQRRVDELARIAEGVRCYRLTIGSLDRAVELIHCLVVRT